jgi:hypothetical protein
MPDHTTITIDPPADSPAATGKRLWVNADRTVLVVLWDTGVMETAVRETSDHIWGPPMRMTEETR